MNTREFNAIFDEAFNTYFETQPTAYEVVRAVHFLDELTSSLSSAEIFICAAYSKERLMREAIERGIIRNEAE